MRAVVIAALLVTTGAGTAAGQDADADANADDFFADDLCDDSALDPVPVALRNGGFDATRSACLRSDLDVRLAGHALVDKPDFYGTLGGELELAIRFVEKDWLEWGVAVRLADVTFAQTAVVSMTEASYGPVSLHAATGHRFGRVQLGGVMLAELPFTRSITDTSAAGGQVAGLAMVRLHPWVVLHGRLGAVGWYGSSAGGSTTRGAMLASSDAAFQMLSWLQVFVGLELGAGWYRSGVDHVAPRAGVHWRILGPWRMDAGVALPLLGEERIDFAVTLGVRRDR